MLGLPGIFTYQKSLSGSPSQLVFSMEDLPGKYLVGFVLQPTNPRHSLKAQMKVGGSIVFESYQQARAVWDINHYDWRTASGLTFPDAYVFTQEVPPDIPSGGRTYNNLSGSGNPGAYPEHWGTYYPPVTPQPNKPLPVAGAAVVSAISPSTTPRNPAYTYNAPHWPVWFVADRTHGQEIRIDVQASMEVPPSSGDLNDDYPVAETDQTFAGVIVGWLMRI